MPRRLRTGELGPVDIDSTGWDALKVYVEPTEIPSRVDVLLG